jgi:hypothetical protein
MRLLRLPDSLLGAAAQAIGFGGIVFMTWAVTRVEGLEAAGRLTVQLGTATGVFGIAQWGLRHALLVEGTSHHGVMDFTIARIVASAVAALVVLLVWLAEGTLGAFAIAALLFKCADGFTDLRLGVLQLAHSPRSTFIAILAENAGKCVVLLALGTFALIMGYIGESMLAAAIAAVGLAGFLLLRTSLLQRAPTSDTSSTRWSSVYSVLKRSTPIAISTMGATVVSTLPRILLGDSHTGERLGVAGVALTCAGVLSLVLVSAWFASAHYVRTSGWSRASLYGLLRTYGQSVVLLVLIAPVFAGVVVVGYSIPRSYFPYTCFLLFAAVVFFSGMGLSNLQKFTPRRSRETVIYLLGAAVLWVAVRVGSLDMSFAMLLSGTTMAASSLTIAFASTSARVVTP